MSPGTAPFIQTQPRLSRFTIRGLLSLPKRLCSPPAAVGKVRSFGLTPIFDVRLEDVLDRKHLPPLSLKDFEEWLLYVEQSVENLYFILWLREYIAKYDRWIAKVRAREAKNRSHIQHGRGGTHSPAAYRVAWSVTTPYSPALALFFSRARETFLVPGAPYELSLPPALLDALAVVSGHPDPAVLAPARAHVEEALRGSLARCVRAAYSNVGTYRAACGIAAGIFFLLVGTIPPLAVNFTRSQSRWERLVILPGLWFGLTIFIASLRGICMMIYIFGDFRQLRKFELVRPPPPTFIPPLEPKSRSPASVAVPTRPVRALTAPPRIAIRIPTNTPSLSYGTTTTVSISTDTSFTGTGTQTSYTNATSQTHAHTISISSLKSRGGTSSLVFPHGHGSNIYADSETRSVPAYASDDESFVDDEECEEDGMSTASDHGIYISPAMPSPDTAAEDDPAVVNAALALIASEAATGSTGQVQLAGLPAPPAQSAIPSGSSAPSTSAPTGPSTSVPTPAKPSLPAPQVPTAPFIPAYPYSDADSVRGRKHSHSRSRSICNKVEDLEAGPTSPSVLLPLGPFDFDALPILPPPPPPAPPAPPAPVASVTGTRPRAPEIFLDTSDLSGLVDEKAQLTLPSPTTSGFGLGLNTVTAVGTATECSPVSPAHSDDAARLCEKGPASVDTVAEMRARGRRASWWGHERSHGGRGSNNNSRSHLPFFLRLPRLFSLFHSRHHSHSASSYNTFSDFYPHTKEHTGQGKAIHLEGLAEGGSRGGSSLSWRTRCALEARVPAFGPVTRVLAPVVARAQWEIVVRAACLAALLCIVACGVVVSLPVPSER
ncbi:hypothetical protein ACEPAI_9155 [Sanghuangporus weigelae]